MNIVKQKAKVYGLIVTRCPECENPINFDRQTTKTCAYCGKEVFLDEDKIQVTLRSIGGKIGGKKAKLFIN